MTSALILVGKKMPENRRDDMCTKNELNSILQKLTQIYRSVYGENLVQVILYGSYARGDYHTDSDVDVLLRQMLLQSCMVTGKHCSSS